MFKRKRKNSQYLRTSVVRKGKFALFWRLSTRGEGGLMSKNQLRITARGLELLKGSCRGVLAEGGGRAASQLWKSSWNQECGGLISIILIVLNTVNLQLQGLFLFLWGQFLELCTWGSLCHGYNLVIMESSSFTCWGLQYLQIRS